MQIDIHIVHIAGTGVVLAVLLAIALLSLLYLGSIFWAFGDAETRGKSGCLVAILVAFFSWPLGLVAWLIFRPDWPKTREPASCVHPMSMRETHSS